MVATVVVVVDEGGDGGLKFALEVVVFEQDAVLQGLVPALEFALGLGCRVTVRSDRYPFQREGSRSSTFVIL
jgi:hypothetical protein